MSPRALEILKRLIAFDTVSSEPNMALIEYVRELLASKGIESLIVKDETGKKANLFASTGPRGASIRCRALVERAVRGPRLDRLRDRRLTAP